MKNVYTSWKPDLLADKMISQILSCWKNPFFSPAVVFTDAKSEQWFKLHWLKKAAGKNPILMNLKTMRLQSFLFDISTPPELAADGKIERVNVELLRDVIITRLMENPDLGDKNASSYIQGSNVRLYDFAQQIASLFLDYEDTRPDNLDELFSACDWQANLRPGELSFGKARYLSLNQIYNLNKKENGTVKFNWDFRRPVFIFGFLGVGQLYRKILSDFAGQGDLYVYLQTGETGQSANELIKAWGGFGAECLELWADDSRPVNFNADYAEDSLLHRVQKSIAAGTPVFKCAPDKADGTISLTGAPNRLREIENVHSKICQLLSEGKAQVGDILIVAQKIQDYKIAIEQVFDQNDKNDTDFPSVPYTIADYSADTSLTGDAMHILFSILQKGYLSRSDVFALLRNSLVQTVRGIADDTVSAWSEWTRDLNVYRGKNWKKAANRLALSRLTDNPVYTEDENYLPYENIYSQDSETLYQFLQAIEELEEWESLADKAELTAEDIDKIYAFLTRWLKLEDSIPPGMIPESFIFQNIIEEIERQKLMTTIAKDGKVLKDCFCFALLDRTSAASLHSASIFSSGVTFANFQANRILPAKYVFFLGLDSKAYPGQDKTSVLDLRSEHFSRKREKGDESIPAKNKNAFLCQLMAAKEGFFLSYVNKDLRKDADFFPSSVVNELFTSIFGKVKSEAYEQKINLDEDRPWKSLFTQREFRNKENFLALKADDDGTESEEMQLADEQSLLPDRVSISSIKTYLKDPFQFMAAQVFSKDEDDSAEEREEFEPIDFSHLTSSALKKAYVQAKLESDQANCSFEQKLKDQGLLPERFFGTIALEKIYSEGDLVLANVKDKYLGSMPIEFSGSVNLLQKYNDKEWHLTGRLAWYNQNYIETKKLIVTELHNTRDVIGCYVTALALLAGLPENDSRDYQVELYSIGVKAGKDDDNFSMTREEAQGILSAIYFYMFVEQYQTCIPESLIGDDKIDSLKKFVGKLTGQNGKWEYFAKKKMFDAFKDTGYTSANFKEEFSAAKEHQRTVLGRLEK